MDSMQKSEKNNSIKTAVEIGALAGELNNLNQAYVLNTINALLFCQKTDGTDTSINKDKTA